VGERSYLSIGDVLNVLREEFPDVTISKIRFLESRGLLVPERTPSGYRKFYERDVDRLRWILRQQRENFLPLKVIKGRLEGHGPGSEAKPLFEMGAEDAPPGEAEVGEPANGSVPAAEPTLDTTAAALLTAASGSATTHDADTQTVSPAGSFPSKRRPEREPMLASVAASGRPEAEGTALSRSSSGSTRPGPPSHPPEPSRPVSKAASTTSPSFSAGPATTEEEAAKESPLITPRPPRAAAEEPPPKVTPASPKESPAPQEESPAASKESPVPPTTVGETDTAQLGGASLTVAELAAASGLEVRKVEELESYGLIESRSVAGVACYDEEALVIAGLAADFARFGVEARHLRMFKHAAERQASVYGQIVMPLLRQRNPTARRRAAEDLARLSELGASIQACFLRAVLRDLTGG
jgi:DNA-binding transcriptional MerR regulator